MAQFPHAVTTEWLSNHLEDPSLKILDATVFMKTDSTGVNLESGQEAYDKEHIPSATFADLITQLSDPNAALPLTALPHDSFVEQARKLGINDDSNIVIYDRGPLVGAPFSSSDWASRLWWQFRLAGHDSVAVLEGGFPKWQLEGRNVSSETSSFSTGTFTGHYRPELLATKDDVKKAMTDRSIVIINCLSPEDFRGDTESYPRKGHIPGSKNVFFGDVSDPNTKGLPSKEKLAKIFEHTEALNEDKKIITYCGGGIAATWNALALAILGREDVAVYDGSMNEWASDESLPLETGNEQ